MKPLNTGFFLYLMFFMLFVCFATPPTESNRNLVNKAQYFDNFARSPFRLMRRRIFIGRGNAKTIDNEQASDNNDHDNDKIVIVNSIKGVPVLRRFHLHRRFSRLNTKVAKPPVENSWFGKQPMRSLSSPMEK